MAIDDRRAADLRARYGFLDTLRARYAPGIDPERILAAQSAYDQLLRRSSTFLTGPEAEERFGIRKGVLTFSTPYATGGARACYVTIILKDGSVFRSGRAAAPDPALGTHGGRTTSFSASLLEDLFGPEMHYRLDGVSFESRDPWLDFSETVVRFRCAEAANQAQMAGSRALELLGKHLDLEALADKQALKRFRMALSHVVFSGMSGRVKFRTGLLRKHLDPDILKVMDRNYLPTLQDYAVLSASRAEVLSASAPTADRIRNIDSLAPWISWDASRTRKERSLRRVQACNAYPLLSRRFVREELPDEFATLGQDTGGETAFLPLIDAGAPLAPAIAASTGAGKAAVRALQGLTWQRSGQSIHQPYLFKGSRRGPRSLALLDLLPPDFFPKDRNEWRAAQKCFDALNTFTPIDDALRRRFLEIRGRWRDYAAIMDDIATARDLTHDYTQRVFNPALERVRSARPECRHFPIQMKKHATLGPFDPSTTPLKVIARLSRLWHQERDTREQAVLERYPELALKAAGWQPFIGEMRPDGPIRIRELTSRSQLVSQGRREMHCVGGYAGEVMSGRTMIFSIENEAGKILSTLSLVLEDDKWRIDQNYAKGNTTPDAACVCAARSVARAANRAWDDDGLRQSYLDALTAAARADRDVERILSRGAKDDDPAFRAEMFERFYSRYQAKGCGHASLDVLGRKISDLMDMEMDAEKLRPARIMETERLGYESARPGDGLPQTVAGEPEDSLDMDLAAPF
ncbi:PcfJ domain-containing protein [Defluviimonas salinarum]|uniref:PcfJ domain-containing protein n=1 Tax=Defluviimonas salinarum TaxID=2992147 RepID=A0ABT3JBG0_9RHOB|nr:PcfJ domain-containing protein [Defluviimonas salinarum]MCW3784779.1 PcfJ domain-containing protein [Defluviimonas salinarum]